MAVAPITNDTEHAAAVDRLDAIVDREQAKIDDGKSDICSQMTESEQREFLELSNAVAKYEDENMPDGDGTDLDETTPDDEDEILDLEDALDRAFERADAEDSDLDDDVILL